MNKEERLEYKEELSCYSKEEMIEKYIDEVEENEILTNQWYKSTQKIKKAISYIYILKNNVKDFKTKYKEDMLNMLDDIGNILGGDINGM